MDEQKLVAVNWRIREIEKSLDTLQKAVDYEEDQLAKHQHEIQYLKIEKEFLERIVFELRSTA